MGGGGRVKGLSASVLVAVAFAAEPAFAQNAAPGVNGYFTLSNGYWAHGLAHNDGLTLQAGVDYQTQGGWFAGAWAANVDYAVEFSYDEPRDYAANVYGGYHRRAAEWSWTVSLAHYLYPGTAVSYDYDELSGTVGFRDRVFYSASYANDYYGGTRASWNHELS